MKTTLALIMTFMGLAYTNRVITGTVYANDDKQPLQWVTVRIAGTNKVSVTDVKGHFTILCPDNKKLIFSYVGYDADTVLLGKGSVLDIWLNNTYKGCSEPLQIKY